MDRINSLLVELVNALAKSKADDYIDEEDFMLLNDSTNAETARALYNIAEKTKTMVDSIKNPDTNTYLTGKNLHGTISSIGAAIDALHDSMIDTPLLMDNDKTLISRVEDDDTVSGGSKPGLWENIRRKKEREGKKYRPAKPGDKDRPDPEMWKKLTK
jgi:hypothetical protein